MQIHSLKLSPTAKLFHNEKLQLHLTDTFSILIIVKCFLPENIHSTTFVIK